MPKPRSPSSRRAWIEISGSRIRRSTACVALLAEGVDRNFAQLYTYTSYANVALLAEGVDRNHHRKRITLVHHMSPSSRRAWIEIPTLHPHARPAAVALLAEGVDRNHTVCLWRCFRGVALLAEGVDRNMIFGGKKHGKMRRPPRGGRG